MISNFEFLSNLLFFEKALDMYFYDFVYKRKKAFQTITWLCDERLRTSALEGYQNPPF